MTEEYTDEQKAIITTAGDRLRWIDTLSEPDRTYAIMGVPEEEWDSLKQWSERTISAIQADRQSEDYARDPDAVNPPSRAHLLRHRGRQDGSGSCPGLGCQR
jgi:hypothetical protein